MKKLLALLLLFLPFLTEARRANPNLLNYEIRTPEQITETTPLVVMLHGYGSNEQDLFSLKNIVPDKAIYLCLRAPIAAENDGFKWWEINRKAKKNKDNEKQMKESALKVMNMIAQIKSQYGITNGKVIIGGFSQGAILSNYILASYPEQVNAIMCLSGRMPSIAKLPTPTSLKGKGVLIIHGKADDVIKVEEGDRVATFFKNNTATIAYRKHNDKHVINDYALGIMTNWLRYYLK